MPGLEERGLIEVRRGVGAYVADRHDWRVLHPDELHALLRAPGHDELVADLIQLQSCWRGARSRWPPTGSGRPCCACTGRRARAGAWEYVTR